MEMKWETASDSGQGRLGKTSEMESQAIKSKDTLWRGCADVHVRCRVGGFGCWEGSGCTDVGRGARSHRDTGWVRVCRFGAAGVEGRGKLVLWPV